MQRHPHSFVLHQLAGRPHRRPGDLQSQRIPSLELRSSVRHLLLRTCSEPPSCSPPNTSFSSPPGRPPPCPMLCSLLLSPTWPCSCSSPLAPPPSYSPPNTSFSSP